MSDFETVALIGIFLVLSAIIVRLIGGDADVAPRTASATPAPQPAPEKRAQPANNPTQRSAVATQPTRFEPPKPQPIEPAMVKVDLPPPTPIPDVRANQAQNAAQNASAAIRPAATTPAAASASRMPEQPTAKPDIQPAAKAATQPITVDRPSTAATIAPPVAPQVATPSAIRPAAVAVEPTPAPRPAVRPSSAMSLGPVTLSRPDVKATLAPGATLSSAAPIRATPPPKQLSAEDQAIISRYLRPDVKATLFREPPAATVQPAAPAAKPAPVAAARPAPAASQTAPRAEAVIVSKPSAAATLPPGYTPPPAMPKAASVGPSTGFAPLGVRPDARATIASAADGATAASSSNAAGYATAAGTVAAAASAQPNAGSNDLSSPRAVRAASITPSQATSSSITPKVSGQASAAETTFLSTAKRGTRVIGSEAASGDIIELERPATPRPQTSSIWSNTVPRRAVTDSEILDPASASQPVSIRAERMPVRAETILVRPDASRTIDPSAPRYVSLSPPPPVASLRNEARTSADAGIRANARFTLPPGALGEE